MAEIVTEQINQPLDMGSMFSLALLPIKFILDNLLVIGFLVLMVIGITVFIVFYVKKQEDEREQEDMLYKEYKDTVRSCKANQDSKLYSKHWSKWNLLFLGLPLIHYRKGRKIYNKRQEIIGFYDGRFIDMLGNINILLWKTKSFIFFKDYFIIRIPTRTYSSEMKTIKTKKGEEEQMVVTHESIQNMDELIFDNPEDKTTTVQMVNHRKIGFYYYPVYMDKHNKILDLTESINTMNHINHSNILLDQVIKESGKNVIGMAKVNTKLVFEQRKPQKVREIDNDDE